MVGATVFGPTSSFGPTAAELELECWRAAPAEYQRDDEQGWNITVEMTAMHWIAARVMTHDSSMHGAGPDRESDQAEVPLRAAGPHQEEDTQQVRWRGPRQSVTRPRPALVCARWLLPSRRRCFEP